jgi:Flp pilus assembly protein TadD
MDVFAMPGDAEEFALSARLHRAGDLDGAEAGYRRTLARSPDHAESLHLLGVLVHQRGRHEVALGSIARAISLAPGRAGLPPESWST